MASAGRWRSCPASCACGAGLARLGFITELLSKPIRYGYMNGIALTVMLSQIPKLFGFSVEADGPMRQAWAIAARHRVRADQLSPRWRSAAGTLVLILFLKRWPRVPGILIAVVAATLVVAVLRSRASVPASRCSVRFRRGCPRSRFPLDRRRRLVPILIGGIAVALVSFADTSVLSRTYAARLRTPVDPNQEMVGLGVANLAAGFFQGFPISSSSSRTPVAEAAGARTQLTGVVGALAIAVLLLVAPDLLRNLPNTALAAVVIASAIGLFEVADLRRIYRIQRWEFWLSMVVLRRRRGVRRDSRHRARDRDRGHRVSLGRLAAAFRRARARRTRARAITTSPAIRMRA